VIREVTADEERPKRETARAILGEQDLALSVQVLSAQATSSVPVIVSGCTSQWKW